MNMWANTHGCMHIKSYDIIVLDSQFRESGFESSRCCWPVSKLGEFGLLNIASVHSTVNVYLAIDWWKIIVFVK